MDKIKAAPAAEHQQRTNRSASSTAGDTFYGNAARYDDDAYETIQRAKLEKTLRGWLKSNLDKAHERAGGLAELRDEVQKLEVYYCIF